MVYQLLRLENRESAALHHRNYMKLAIDLNDITVSICIACLAGSLCALIEGIVTPLSAIQSIRRSQSSHFHHISSS